MNQTQAVKEHLMSGKGLTSMDAIKKFGCTRLSDKIYRLRRQGYKIVNVDHEIVNRYGDRTRFVEYRLMEDQEDGK